jgi:hypothetical protein
MGIACVCVALAIGCSGRGGSSGPADAEAEAEPTVDPCQPACCCKVRENYYVRYRCSLPSECSADGGECVTEKLSKCRSSADGSST